MSFIHIFICISIIFSEQVTCLTFWHITDTHSDWLYTPGTNPIADYCRRGEGTAGYYGDH